MMAQHHEITPSVPAVDLSRKGKVPALLADITVRPADTPDCYIGFYGNLYEERRAAPDGTPLARYLDALLSEIRRTGDIAGVIAQLVDAIDRARLAEATK
ncbi:hypothetical protein E3E14_16670 [Streptomyces sp. ICN441]|uniref:hypothetical protein n=1 Tax=Streptomyces sp. ICN441 TaxID=2558286 RepID=UPI00106AEEC7|nr:hypothetical protein [Streptomyces sp. ICN441]TFE49000.1 hypothetical protein E3E14_16670 [Streptomyces sp. ICN441]